MSMEQWWNDPGRGKPKHSEKKFLYLYQIVHKNFHMEWPGINPGPCGGRPG